LAGLLPVVVLGPFFAGYATIVDTSAIAAVYAFVVQVLIHRNIAARQIPRVFADCVTTIGGVLIILAVAYGFSQYRIDAGVPTTRSNSSESAIMSPRPSGAVQSSIEGEENRCT
jgi:C4-dicarboxylate transporter DctM subunit